MEKLKKSWRLIVFCLIVIPLVVKFVITFFTWNGSGDGWLGFWGNCLGAISSGLIAYYVAKIQIDAEKENYRKNHLEDLLLDDLREIHSKLIKLNKLSEFSKFSDDDMDLINEIEFNSIIEEINRYKIIPVEIVSLVDNIPNYSEKLQIKKFSKELYDSISIICNINTDLLVALESTSSLSSKNYVHNVGSDPREWKLDRAALVKESNRIKKYSNEIASSYNKLNECVLKEINKLSSF